VRWRGHADLLALVDDEAVEKLDLGAPALDHILTHRRPVRTAAGFLRLGEAVRVIFRLRLQIAFAGSCNRLRLDVVDLLELVAEPLADPDRLAPEPGREMAQLVVEQYVAADEAGAGRHPVRHGVGDELRPAFAPKVLRHFCGVRERNEAADLPG